MPTIPTADGLALHVESWGDGPPSAALSRMGSRLPDVGLPVPALMDAGYRAVVFNRRGHGRSDVATGGYDLDTLAADVSAVIEALDLRDLTVVGHSASAQEVLRSITNQGDARLVRCRALGADHALHPTAHRLPRRDPRIGLRRTPRFVAAQLRRLDQSGAEAYFGEAEVSEALRQVTVRALSNTALPVILATHRTLTSADLRSDLAGLQLPVTVLHGTADASAPLELTGEPTARLARNGRLVTISGGGHGMYRALPPIQRSTARSPRRPADGLSQER